MPHDGNLITWHGSFRKSFTNQISLHQMEIWLLDMEALIFTVAHATIRKLESWLSFCEHSQSSNLTWRGNLETIPDLPCFAICWGLFFLLNYVKSTNCCQFGFSYANVALLHWGEALTWKTSKCDNIFVSVILNIVWNIQSTMMVNDKICQSYQCLLRSRDFGHKRITKCPNRAPPTQTCWIHRCIDAVAAQLEKLETDSMGCWSPRII